MKALITIMSILLAVFLVCDPQVGIVSYDVEVDGVVVSNIPAESDGSILYNVDHLPVELGGYRVKVVFRNNGEQI